MSDLLIQLNTILAKTVKRLEKHFRKVIEDHVKKCVEEQTKVGGQETVLADWKPNYDEDVPVKDANVLYLFSCINQGMNVVKFGCTDNINRRLAEHRSCCENINMLELMLVHTNYNEAEQQLLQIVRDKYRPCIGNEWFVMPIDEAKKIFIDFHDNYRAKMLEAANAKKMEEEQFRDPEGFAMKKLATELEEGYIKNPDADAVLYDLGCYAKCTDEQLQLWNELHAWKYLLDEFNDECGYSITIIIPKSKDISAYRGIEKCYNVVSRTYIVLPEKLRDLKDRTTLDISRKKRLIASYTRCDDYIICFGRLLMEIFESNRMIYNRYYDENNNIIDEFEEP